MNYRQLQKVLKRYKQEGLTDIALNSKKAVLQAELDRLRRTFGERIESILAVSESQEANKEIDINDSEAKQTITELKAKYIDQATTFTDEEKESLDSTREKSETPCIQVTNEPIFPKKRKGLIHSTVHILQCTCIMASRIVVPRPRIPVIYIPRAYQSAMPN